MIAARKESGLPLALTRGSRMTDAFTIREMVGYGECSEDYIMTVLR